MKKLSLGKLNLETVDLLPREQLKIVFGGYNGSGCAYEAGNGYAGQVGPNMTSSEAQNGA